MNFWSRLRGDRKHEEIPAATHPDPWALASAQRPAHRTIIPYDPHLVKTLLSEHRKLLALFGEIHDSFAVGDVVRTAACLRKFTSEIQVHLLTEQIELYVYLQDVLPEKGRNMVCNMQQEMDAIGEAVINFLNKYRTLDKEADLLATFAADLGGIGAALVKRVESEESTLLPLYRSQAALAAAPAQKPSHRAQPS